MNAKVNYLENNELVEIFKKKTGWNLARVKLLVSLICAVCKLQTVNFPKLAQGLGGNALFDSNLRRIQRFFAEFIVDSNLIAKIVFSLLPHTAPLRLSIDRTNWKFGKTDINIFAISVCYCGIGIPLLWTMLPKRGNSNQQERIDLINRYIRLFGILSIESILADREFIGDEWIGDLIKKGIHFYFRIKANMKINIPGKGEHKAFWLFNSLPLYEAKHYYKIVQVGTQWMYISGLKTIDKKGKIEFVIIATFSFDPLTMTVYKDRWQIETMFKGLKSSGFNIECTHLTDLGRISKLLCVLCLAFIWAYLTGIYRHNFVTPIKIKKHGRRAYSFFKYGLIFISHALQSLIESEIHIITKILSCT